MARANVKTKHKHYVLDEMKIKRAQKLLGTTTETETTEHALEEVITEIERNRTAWCARKRFLKSGIQIRDVYGIFERAE